jgi:hypothetical protein
LGARGEKNRKKFREERLMFLRSNGNFNGKEGREGPGACWASPAARTGTGRRLFPAVPAVSRFRKGQFYKTT